MTEDTEQIDVTGDNALAEQLNRIEADVKEIKTAMAKMRTYMFWKLIVLVLVVFLPLLALPFVMHTFINTYLSGYNGLL